MAYCIPGCDIGIASLFKRFRSISMELFNALNAHFTLNSINQIFHLTFRSSFRKETTKNWLIHHSACVVPCWEMSRIDACPRSTIDHKSYFMEILLSECDRFGGRYRSTPMRMLAHYVHSIVTAGTSHWCIGIDNAFSGRMRSNGRCADKSPNHIKRIAVDCRIRIVGEAVNSLSPIVCRNEWQQRAT